MDLKELMRMQTSFSESRGWFFHKAKNRKDFISKLQYDSIALAGEVGEFANIVKKILRSGEHPSEEMMQRLREELTDVFIYVILTSSLLNFDLEKEYLATLRKNENRFQKKN